MDYKCEFQKCYNYVYVWIKPIDLMLRRHYACNLKKKKKKSLRSISMIQPLPVRSTLYIHRYCLIDEKFSLDFDSTNVFFIVFSRSQSNLVTQIIFEYCFDTYELEKCRF